jgi:hypothetical protein
MPITFDTLDELKAFYRTFKLDEKLAEQALSVALPGLREDKPRRGRPPAQTKKVAEKQTMPTRRGRKPGSVKAAANIAKPKREKGDTLTSKIQDAIQGYLNKNASFTANDIYGVLAKKDAGVNKQSVITSVLKQMNSTFKTISVSERPGNGPRPVKLYNAS